MGSEIKKDPEPTREELDQAEALAQALAGEEAPSTTPDDAYEMAALLRYAEDSKLAEDRQADVLQRVLAAGVPETQEKAGLGLWWRWLAPVSSLAAVTALVLVLATHPELPRTHLPAPDAGLLNSLAQAASGEQGSAQALKLNMRQYREKMFSSLNERYGSES